MVSILQQSALTSGLQGIQVCQGTPTINHLLFTDDNLIFYKASKATSQQLLENLHKYERALGQLINMDKTKMVFNHNVQQIVKDEISALWETTESQQYEKYLGVPLIIGRSKKWTFLKIKARIW